MGPHALLVSRGLPYITFFQANLSQHPREKKSPKCKLLYQHVLHYIINKKLLGGPATRIVSYSKNIKEKLTKHAKSETVKGTLK